MKENRRTFIKKSVLSATGISLGIKASAKSYRNIMGANEKLNIAFVDTNGRGRAIFQSASEVFNVLAPTA